MQRKIVRMKDGKDTPNMELRTLQAMLQVNWSDVALVMGMSKAQLYKDLNNHNLSRKRYSQIEKALKEAHEMFGRNEFLFEQKLQALKAKTTPEGREELSRRLLGVVERFEKKLETHEEYIRENLRDEKNEYRNMCAL